MSITPIEKLVFTWYAQGSDRVARARAEQLLSNSPSSRLRAQHAAKGLRLFRRPALFVEELLTLAQVDLAHAQQVAAHALALFDACAADHGLGPRHRQLLEQMALLHNVGVSIDEPRHHLAGRDVLQVVRLVGVTPLEQRAIACAVRFHRKAVHPKDEPLFTGLPVRWQTPTLLLSALLRIADGLDYSTSQTTRIAGIQRDGNTLHLTVMGPEAAQDAARAIAKADLWRVVAQEPLDVIIVPDLESLASRDLTPSTNLVAAFNRALADQLRRWHAAQPGAQADDQRSLKALRAAARRSNAAMWVFGDCFRRKPVVALRSRLKDSEKVLGEVRDWDLAIDEAAEAFEGEDNGLLADWRKQHERARKKAAAWFDQEADALRDDLERFLVETPLKKGSTFLLGHEAPKLLLRPLKRLRDAFNQLDRDDELPALHQVRIALKRVRFTIEFLVPLYGEPAEKLLPVFIRAQDRLGGINDLHVAHNRVLDYLSRNPGDADALDYARLLAGQIKKQLAKAEADVQPLRPDVLAVEFSRWALESGPVVLHVDMKLEPENDLD